MSEMTELERARRGAAAKVTPLYPYVVVLPVVPEAQTDSGIHLVQMEDATPAKAEVVKTPVEQPYLTVEVGDIVLLKKYQGLLYEIDGQEVMLVPFEAIVGRVS